MECFNEDNFISLCDKLAKKDKDLKTVIKQYGYPPFWSRIPSFATLIHIILEQQVSLASAKAALLKLEAKIGHITPEKVLSLSDEEMKACYFSRQKIIYAKHLALSIVNGELLIEKLIEMDDESLRTEMKKLKGIGDWTVDVFMMMALHRCDCFPTGDIALMKSVKEVKGLDMQTDKEEILLLANGWKPYRTLAAFILWHAYIKKRNLVI
ncbi:DNA-3-methyladenine glycosylase 2 family protein [Panacibacter ginsenosidivorans]|uniref:DNA-3-methyladenine glycosylase II n=1 Tax=Panacibacter ginsenosidivorans TaxID=1813871 RepID=A0A5B8VAH5_9BACT|nr:DNA-3-methyladenine glycosylase [Panacibacter ginsenosidivorans]QEC68125.1 DNA-3-methyladenine glycosylase 2 family protein [Panacibacter ginsenosidivorans]